MKNLQHIPYTFRTHPCVKTRVIFGEIYSAIHNLFLAKIKSYHTYNTDTQNIDNVSVMYIKSKSI